MIVKDFVSAIINLADDINDIYVNEIKVYDRDSGLVFNEVLYRALFLTDLEFTGRTVYIEGNLPTTRISEAVAGGKQINDKLIVTKWAMYLREGFNITEIVSRSEIKEMFSL